MRKKRFSVKASMSAKRRNAVKASARPMRKRVCATQRPITPADRKRCIDFVARDYGVTKKQATEWVKDYSDDRIRDLLGMEQDQAKLAFVYDSKKVKCARSMRKRVCASNSDKEYSITLDRDSAYDLKAFLRKNHINFEPSGVGMLTHFYLGHLTSDEVRMINDYLDELNEYPIDVEDYRESLPVVNSAKSVRCARSMRKRSIKASESGRKRYSIVLSRNEANELKDFLRKNRIKFDSSGYGADTYIQFDLTKRESDMINDFLDAVADHATIDVEEYFERLPEVNSAKSVRCARSIRKRPARKSIKCAEYTSLRDRDITYADDVTELVLYITNDSDLYHQRTLPIIENLKRKAKKGQYNDELAIKAWQYLADDGVRKYDKEFGSGRGSVGMLNPATRKEIAKQLRDYYREHVFEDINASTRVIKSDYDLGFSTRDDDFTVDAYYGSGNDPFRGFADGITTDDWSEIESFAHEKLMSGLNVRIDSEYGVLEITADEYNDAWDNGAADFDINEDIVNYKNRIVNSSKSIKCSAFDDDRDIVIYYNGSKEYEGSIYRLFKFLYSIMFRDANAKVACAEYLNGFGDPLIDDPQTASASEVANVLAKEIEYEANEGELYVDINWNGGRIEIFDAADQAITSAKSIRCEDEDAEIVEDDFADDETYDGAYTDEDYEDDTAELTVDISNLELGEPSYEIREDDPENPDKWVLVIGKNPEKQMNYKLWYYVDSTDADLTSLDLSNPDHIDIDEESTLADYDDIQLATKVSCKDDRYSADLVTM